MCERLTFVRERLTFVRERLALTREHTTHMNESCYTQKCNMCHTWTSHVTHMYEIVGMCVATWHSLSQCVAVCYSVLQCVADISRHLDKSCHT